jgi:hypothetical protein
MLRPTMCVEEEEVEEEEEEEEEEVNNSVLRHTELLTRVPIALTMNRVRA